MPFQILIFLQLPKNYLDFLVGSFYSGRAKWPEDEKAKAEGRRFFMQKRVHVYYSGYVQGVGFRYTARRIAGQFGVCGWVRNLPDERVEFTAEAEEELLKKTLEAIKNSFQRYIKDTEIDWRQADGEFAGFEIRF